MIQRLSLFKPAVGPLRLQGATRLAHCFASDRLRQVGVPHQVSVALAGRAASSLMAHTIRLCPRRQSPVHCRAILKNAPSPLAPP